VHLSHEQRRLLAIAGRARASSADASPDDAYVAGSPASTRARRDSPEAPIDAGGELGLERRHCERIGLASQLLLRPVGGFNCEVRLDNVSVAGCQVELIEPAEPGETMIARFPQLEPIGADVRWSQGTTAGLRFSRPMHSAVLDSLLERL
jgi:hypothetical protein